MTTDQLTAQQKASSGFGPTFFADHCWGFGLYVVTERTGLSSKGSYGWKSPTPPPVFADFWTQA